MIGRLVMHRSWSIQCACGDFGDVHEDTRPKAVKEFRRVGWRLREERWSCPRCSGTELIEVAE